MHPSPDPALKPDPITCTMVDPSTAPADGTTPTTTAGDDSDDWASERRGKFLFPSLEPLSDRPSCLLRTLFL